MAFQVIFFGTSEIGIPTLAALSESKKIDVQAVITQSDKKTGRKAEMTAPPIKVFAQEKNLPIFQPESLKDNPDFVQFLKTLKPDLFVVLSYGKILPKEILEIPTYGAVNIHTSLLPKFRGASPIQEALLQGEKETGLTVIKMNEYMDEGGIILVRRIPVEEKDDYITLEKKLAVLSGEIIPLLVHDYIEGTLPPLPQKHEKATYCKKIEKEDGKIDWQNDDAEKIQRKMKAFKKWPGVFTMWNGKRIKILAAEIENSEKGTPGEITFEKDRIAVATKKGSLIPTVLQMEGKKEMEVEEFLRGYEKVLKENPRFE